MSLDREAARAQVPAPGVTGFYLAAALDDLDAKDAEFEKLREALAAIYERGCFPGIEPRAFELWSIAREALATSSEGVTDATS